MNLKQKNKQIKKEKERKQKQIPKCTYIQNQ